MMLLCWSHLNYIEYKINELDINIKMELSFVKDDQENWWVNIYQKIITKLLEIEII